MSAPLELTPEHPPETLLFVDDERNILSALRRLFRPLGYTIHLAESGPEGLEILSQHPIDLVISDMRMPDMDGARFLEIVADKWPGTMRFLLTGFSDLHSTVEAINKGRIYRYLSKPWEDTEIRLSVRQALETQKLQRERDLLTEQVRYQNKRLRVLNEGLEAEVLARTEEIRQTADMLDLAYRELSESYQQTIRVFASLIGMREHLCGRHAERVAELGRAMALAQGMDDAAVRDVYFCGLLHELGKLTLPDEILKTPVLLMKKAAREKYLRHPLNGQNALMAIEGLQSTASLIRAQEEHFDGRGFPDHLQGAQIPLGARIICIARDFYAHQNGRLTGHCLNVADTLQHMRTLAGRCYDPELLRGLEPILRHLRAEPEPESERLCRSRELIAGMKLSRDLFNRNDLLLLTRGRVLTDALIHKLRKLEELDQGTCEYYIQRSKD